MSSPEAHAILEPSATKVRDPRTGRSVWLAGMIKESSLTDSVLEFTIQCHPDHSDQQMQMIRDSLVHNITQLGWKGEIICNLTVEESVHSSPQSNKTTIKTPKKEEIKGMGGGGMQPHGGPIHKQPIPGVKKIIAVASGKGGVGKSTVAVNLAVALTRLGKKVGLLDADVYGPSLPMMMKIQGTPIANDEKQIIPLVSYGVQCISMGFLVEEKEPIIWRGPMVMGAIKQFFQNVAWEGLDFLIVDLPPGTGDAQLTMIQAVQIDGAVIVTTPQAIAVQDAVRGVEMFKKLHVPIVGIVENMSFFSLPDGSMVHPFGRGGGFETAIAYQVPLLAQLPLDERIRLGGDMGMPVALASDESCMPFVQLAENVLAGL